MLQLPDLAMPGFLVSQLNILLFSKFKEFGGVFFPQAKMASAIAVL